MLTLLKGLECFCPQYSGKNDILIINNKIEKICEPGRLEGNPLLDEEWDCGGFMAFPGIIDQHVHIIGGGGEQGPASRIGEIDVQDVFSAGVTTLVGLLGADCCTKNLESLYAKAKSLENQGLTTYIYSGSYSLPAVTLTQNIMRDLCFIDKVIGTGEIAISDHRSSHADTEELLKIASDTHLGGMLGGKAGVVHLHVGDGRKGLEPLLELEEKSELPKDQFVPTHVNRNPDLFRQAQEYCRNGGNIDLTAGEKAGIPVPDAVEQLVNSGMDLSRVTVSSDANGSIPSGGVSRIASLYADIRRTIIEKGIEPSAAFRLVTENVAKILKIYPNKGTLREGGDADILITDRDCQIQKLFSMGKIVLDHGCNSKR